LHYFKLGLAVDGTHAYFFIRNKLSSLTERIEDQKARKNQYFKDWFMVNPDHDLPAILTTRICQDCAAAAALMLFFID
jgi:hypothetical protein